MDSPLACTLQWHIRSFHANFIHCMRGCPQVLVLHSGAVWYTFLAALVERSCLDFSPSFTSIRVVKKGEMLKTLKYVDLVC